MDPYQKYKNATVVTEDSVKQLIFVFDEVIKLLHIAKKSIGEKDYETKYKTLTKVVDVFYILRSGIDIEKGGEVTKVLDNFYLSIIRNLEQANIKADIPEDIEVIITSVKMVRDSIHSEMQNQEANTDNSNSVTSISDKI